MARKKCLDTRSKCTQLYERGCSYKRSADVTLNIVRSYVKNNQPSNIGLWLYPTVTNYAFACELFLKSLYFSEKGKQHRHTHNLLTIFNNLSPTLRKEIIKKTGYKQNEFLKELKKNSLLFESYRYPDDASHGNLVLIEKLGVAVENFSNKYRDKTV